MDEINEVILKDDSSDKKYFTITPRIVKAMSRNAYDFALWDTIKDVVGESGGECYLNTEQLAILSGMSTGSVSNSRRYWLKIGFLKGHIRKDAGYHQGVWHITVPDLWAKNIEWCEKYPKMEARLAFRKEHRRLHLVKPSPGEGKPSPGETKKIIKEDQELIINRRAALLATLYEANITLITPLMADTLKDAAEEFADETWYKDAFKIAVESNARTWRFVYTVLTNWKKHGRDWTPPSFKKARNGKTPKTQPLPAQDYDYDALRKQMAESQKEAQ
jgi:DnaD/phage-associated family protein